MMRIIKRIIKGILNQFGYKVILPNYKNSHELVINKLIEDHQIEVVLDVGANTGQFAKSLRQSGFGGKIISFEPLSSAWKELKENSEKDELWIVADRVALGNEIGVVEINIAGNSASSSILSMESTCKEAAPESAYIDQEEAPLSTLDHLFQIMLAAHLSGNLFLKIDTQGYELMVLEGAKSLLTHVHLVELEISFVELYTGQVLYRQIIDYMEEQGFTLWSIFPMFSDKSTSRMLQADAIFVRI